MGRADNPQVYSGRLDQPHIFISELHLLLSPESSPSDPSANTPSSYPTLSEVFGRKRKKRTSIETNIRLTLEKRFQDVSSLLGWEGWASLCRWVSGSHMWRKLVSVPLVVAKHYFSPPPHAHTRTPVWEQAELSFYSRSPDMPTVFQSSRTAFFSF